MPTFVLTVTAVPTLAHCPTLSHTLSPSQQPYGDNDNVMIMPSLWPLVHPTLACPPPHTLALITAMWWQCQHDHPSWSSCCCCHHSLMSATSPLYPLCAHLILILISTKSCPWPAHPHVHNSNMATTTTQQLHLHLQHHCGNNNDTTIMTTHPPHLHALTLPDINGHPPIICPHHLAWREWPICPTIVRTCHNHLHSYSMRAHAGCYVLSPHLPICPLAPLSSRCTWPACPHLLLPHPMCRCLLALGPYYIIQLVQYVVISR